MAKVVADVVAEAVARAVVVLAALRGAAARPIQSHGRPRTDGGVRK